MRAPLLLGLLALVLAFPAALQAEEDPDAGQREAARKAVLIERSKAAKTSTLGLSPGSTGFLDLWLDFCRSKHQRRVEESMHFSGVPHAEWGGTEGVLLFKVAFVNLELARAELPAADAPALFHALIGPDFVKAVRVDGDDDRWVRLWAVMLATEVADRRGDVWTGETWSKAVRAVRDGLVETVAKTAPLGDGVLRIGSLESERLVWLLGIRAMGCGEEGAILCRLYAERVSEEIGKDARAIASILAACPGEEAEAFILRELESGDWERQRTVLSGCGVHATPAVIERVVALAREVESDERAQMAIVVLQRAAAAEAERRADAAKAERGPAATTLRALMDGMPADSERKTMAAMALVQSENADPEVCAYLAALVERLETEEDAHPGRVAFLRRVLERAQAQLEAQATSDVGG